MMKSDRLVTRRQIAGLSVVIALVAISAPASAYDMFEMTTAGRASGGINTSMSLTRTSSELTDGETALNTTFFLLAAPKFGYFLADRVELSAQAGLIMRRLQRQSDEGNTETAALLNVGLNYHVPLNANLSLIPGFGLGGYFGGGSRPATIVDSQGERIEIEETTRARGVNLSSQLLLGYRATEKAQIQAGVGLNYLYGAEFSENVDALTSSTLNVSMLVSAVYFF